jgi:Plasmid pRiA4b ORF-3-like protein
VPSKSAQAFTQSLPTFIRNTCPTFCVINAHFQRNTQYLHQFHIYGKDYGLSYVGGILFSENPHDVYLDDFGFDEGDKFTYEYNFFEHTLVDIRIENINNTSAQAPVYCMKGKGMPGANKYDTTEATLNLFEALANADESTTVGDLRPFVDALNAICLPLTLP